MGSCVEDVRSPLGVNADHDRTVVDNQDDQSGWRIPVVV